MSGPHQVDIAQRLVALGQSISNLPDHSPIGAPICSQRYAQGRDDVKREYDALTEAILHHLASIMERDKAIIELIQQAQTDVKYMSFDLEATRREKARLQRQIDSILGAEDDPEL